MKPIIFENVIAECADLAEAKEIARDMKKSALAVASKYGADHPIAKSLSDRYWDFVDVMAASKF